MSTDVYVVRHGQTEGNIRDLFCGHTETPLTALGVAQARAVGRRLAHVSFAAAYASDLSRASDTARHALHGRDLPVSHDPRLREMYYGDWEGLPGKELGEKYPDIMRAFFTGKGTVPGGESIAALRRRTTEALHDAVARHRGDPVLLVSHGNALMAMVAEALGLPVENTWAFSFENTSLSHLHVSKSGRVSVRFLNDATHIQGIEAE